MNEEIQSVWRDAIVDHSQFPRRHGRLEKASHEGNGENPFCGDRIRLQLLIDDSGLISDVGFEASGCAISMASASLLASHLAGKGTREAKALFRNVHALLTADDGPVDTGLGELEALGLVRQYPSRIKCATLAWHVMRHVLEGGSDPVTTETG